MELESAIQELLSRLEFVSLPGLGSFVKKYEPATLSPDGKLFNPPKEYYIFDTSRIFNDEALENFVCETANTDHSNASTIVANFVNAIKTQIDKGNEFLIDGIGVLKANSSGQIELTYSGKILSHTYGLTPIDLPHKESSIKKEETSSTVKKQEEVKPIVNKETPKKNEPTPSTSKSKKGILIPLLIIIGVVCLGVIIVLVPKIQFIGKNTNSIVVDAEDINNQNPEKNVYTTIDSSLVQVDSTMQGSDSSYVSTGSTVTNNDKQVAQVSDKKSALYYKETKQTDSKTFFIIAGSFSQEINAQKLIQELSQKGYKPTLLQTDNMYRVAIYKFTNRDRALRELERLKSQKISDKVWLLSL